MDKAQVINARLSSLRSAMVEDGVDFYLITSTDPHSSEYVCDHFKVTEYFSGCTSDNVVLLVSSEEALLWTDSRYHISAAAELAGTGIYLMKDGLPGVPTANDYLKTVLKKAAEAHTDKSSGKQAAVLGYDGSCISASAGERYRQIAEETGALIKGSCNTADRVWDGDKGDASASQSTGSDYLVPRPALPSHPLWIVPDELAGRSFREKLADVRASLAGQNAQNLVLSKLDDIMWLTNLRGADVECNPVALSYAILTPDSFALFVQDSELTDEIRTYAEENGITLKPYESFYEELEHTSFEGGVLADKYAVSARILSILKDLEHSAESDPENGSGRNPMRVILSINPTTLLKAVKNPVEIKNSRKYYLLDSAAVCKFIYRIKKSSLKAMEEKQSVLKDKNGDSLTEYTAAMMLDGLRAQIDGFLGLSFDTISAVGPNAAMAHYSASEDNCAVIEPHGFLLVDSGGQYYGATTDITRTIVIGDLTPEMKRDFTLVASANLRLLTLKFPKGTTGSQLDFLTRAPLHAHGIDFGHGTGHGIGYILNVHEGPQRIAPHRPGAGPETAFVPGMITSDEPGVYRENEYGIRTESIVLSVRDEENEFGIFYRMDPLTFVPIDLDAIDPAYLDSGDIERLNAYHKEVYKKVAPLLTEEEAAWLKEATREI